MRHSDVYEVGVNRASDRRFISNAPSLSRRSMREVHFEFGVTKREASDLIRVRPETSGQIAEFSEHERIEAMRKNASAFRLRFSQSLASLRQRLSHAIVRSTIQRLGKTTNPLT